MSVFTYDNNLQHPVTAFVLGCLNAASDESKVAPMQAYMKTSQPFFGGQAELRKQILRKVKRQCEIDGIDNYYNIVAQLWQEPHRESQYMAILLAEHFREYRASESMPLFRWMVSSSKCWDTLDPIATNLVGQLVLAQRNDEKNLIRWQNSEHLWSRRASLLAHLKHRTELNFKLISATILVLATDRDFFIRKAIGWLLREMSKLHPDWVSHFVMRHRTKLSGLSQREALKRLKVSY